MTLLTYDRLSLMYHTYIGDIIKISIQCYTIYFKLMVMLHI